MASLRPDLAAFRGRSFLVLFVARTLSLMGNAIAPVALAFAVLELTAGSATTLGLVLTARVVAQLGFLLFGGVIADRLPRHRVMVVADVTAGLAQAVIATLFITQQASVAAIAALSMVNGAAFAMFQPAARAVVPQLVPSQLLQSANALLRLSMNAGSITGAAIAGVLIALIGPGWTLTVDALSFLVSAALISVVRIRKTPSTGKTTLIAQLRDGWKEFTARRWVWAMVVQLGFANVCIAGGIMVLGPIVAKAHLGGAPAWAAAVAAQSTGLVVGSLVGMRFRPRFPVRSAALLTFGFVPPMLSLAFHAPIAMLAMGMFITGFCIDLYEVLFQTALQTHIPPEALARVMSYDSFGSFALIPVGLAVVGPISDLVGVQPTLLGAAGLVATSGLVVLLSASVRNLREEPRHVESSSAR